MIKEYPVRDCTIMDIYLIDNGWELQPVMNRQHNNEALWSFSTMGLISRTYVKGEEKIFIGIMLAATPIHVGYKHNYYYMPSENPKKFLKDMMAGKLESITSILYKKKLAENPNAKHIKIN